ncbi:hypothetical protein HZH68_002489 [Vespula germanica]|uniref:Uncharacterized protein n=1 Tax=Vespula germanica TaxID=30212 RepID=A0A834U0B4_VESGE|nr:hypothetical protein HZH68_002489 [Vespula germanica]
MVREIIRKAREIFPSWIYRIIANSLSSYSNVETPGWSFVLLFGPAGRVGRSEEWRYLEAAVNEMSCQFYEELLVTPKSVEAREVARVASDSPTRT